MCVCLMAACAQLVSALFRVMLNPKYEYLTQRRTHPQLTPLLPQLVVLFVYPSHLCTQYIALQNTLMPVGTQTVGRHNYSATQWSVECSATTTAINTVLEHMNVLMAVRTHANIRTYEHTRARRQCGSDKFIGSLRSTPQCFNINISKSFSFRLLNFQIDFNFFVITSIYTVDRVRVAMCARNMIRMLGSQGNINFFFTFIILAV